MYYVPYVCANHLLSGTYMVPLTARMLQGDYGVVSPYIIT